MFATSSVIGVVNSWSVNRLGNRSAKRLRSYGLKAAAVLVCLLASPLQADEALKEGETVIPVMFVQNATSSHYHDGMLTLSGVQPHVVWFSNRPYRLAGTSTMAEYMQDWDAGADSFKADPPNGSLSYQKGDAMHSVAMTLSDPLQVGDKVSYKVQLLEGELPTKTGPVSLFIDFVGMVWHRPPVVGGAVVVRRPVVVTRPFMFRPAPVVVTTPNTVVVKKAPPTTVVVKKPAPTTVVVEKSSPNEVKVVPASETEKKLAQLKSMYDQGLISRREYKHKQEELLKQF